MLSNGQLRSTTVRTFYRYQSIEADLLLAESNTSCILQAAGIQIRGITRSVNHVLYSTHGRYCEMYSALPPFLLPPAPVCGQILGYHENPAHRLEEGPLVI